MKFMSFLIVYIFIFNEIAEPPGAKRKRINTAADWENTTSLNAIRDVLGIVIFVRL